MVSSALDALQRHLHGTLLMPGDAAYDEVRALWNGMFDKRPLAIARCADTADVVATVTCAREGKVELAVRGGGHNVAGFASLEGGLVLDLSTMNEVKVEPERRRARVGGGATLGDVDRETQRYGLALPSGLFSRTGIAGLTLGGGIGWLRRKYGLTCDNLVGAEVVIADERVLRVNERENPNLLWGCVVVGGNFGVVTEFEFQLHPVGPEVAFAFVLYPLHEAQRVLRAHETYIEGEPGDVSTLVVLGRVAHTEPFPPELWGTPFVGILAMHAGNVEEGMTALQPLRELVTPLCDLSGPMPYTEAQRLFDADYPDGERYYWKSTLLPVLSDVAIGSLIASAERAPSDHSTIDIWYHGGAVARLGASETAYGRRDAPYLISPEANWHDPADDAVNIAWSRDCLAAFEDESTGGLYLNFPGFGDEARLEAVYGENFMRLRELKSRYDPKNLFRQNQNILPLG